MGSKVIEKLVEGTYRELTKEKHGDSFNKQLAKVFAVEVGGTIRILCEHGDVYEALEKVADIKLLDTDIAIGYETCGWASPRTSDDDDSVAPSQHPERRRVRLVTLITRKFKVASALGFADTPDEITTDAGKATGALAEELLATMKSMVKSGK